MCSKRALQEMWKNLPRGESEMSSLATNNAHDTQAGMGSATNKACAMVGLRLSGNLDGQTLKGSSRPAGQLGLVLPALLAGAGSALVIGTALIAFGIPAQFRDPAVALL